MECIFFQNFTIFAITSITLKSHATMTNHLTFYDSLIELLIELTYQTNITKTF